VGISTVVLVSGAAAIAVSLIVLRMDRRATEAVVLELANGPPAWQGALELWRLDSAYAALGNLSVSEGNAADVYWPDGFGPRTWTCIRFFGQKADGPTWERDTETWRLAAEYPALDTLVVGAGMSRLDILAPEFLERGGSSEILSEAWSHYDWLRYGIAGLTARARVRALENESEEAEQDLRAVISVGLQLVEGSPTLIGMEIGHTALEFGLTHLAWLNERRGDSDLAESARRLVSELPSRESCRGPVKSGMPNTFSSLDAVDLTRELATDADLPLAFRLSAVSALRWGHGRRPIELLFGPDPDRRTMARMVADEAGLVSIWPNVDEQWDDGWPVRMEELFRVLIQSL